jgi:hypothetical protein
MNFRSLGRTGEEGMSDMKLLQEWSPFNLTEGGEGRIRKEGGRYMMSGILQKADVLNQNGRIYPYAVLKREVENYQKFIRENRALGELDHPAESVIELKNVSHIIREAHMGDGGIVKGNLEVLDTPTGKILKSLVDGGVTIGISSRGVGSTKNEGGRAIVQEDFQLICWDVVSEPSTPNAFIMREGRQLTSSELNMLRRKYFTSEYRIDRILTDIVGWRK